MQITMNPNSCIKIQYLMCFLSPVTSCAKTLASVSDIRYHQKCSRNSFEIETYEKSFP